MTITDRSATPLRVGLYRRVSTQEQKMSSYSPEMQRDESLVKFAHKYGDISHTLRAFDDLGKSGALGVYDPSSPKADHREGLTALFDAIARGELDLVLCYAQDRLARDEYLWHFANTMFFQEYGVPVLFAREDHNIMTNEGQMLSSFHAMVAALERRKISENVSAAVRRRVMEGYSAGPPPYAWKWDPDQVPRPRERRRIVRGEAKGIILAQIRERYLSGWPTVEIVRDLHHRGIESPGGGLRWSTDGLLKVMRNPIHAGVIRHKEERHPGQHAQLRYWSPEDHGHLEQCISDRVDRLVKARSVEEYLLSGVVYCEHCGRRLVGNKIWRTGARSYACFSPRTEGNHTNRSGKHAGQPRTCPRVHQQADELESAIRTAVSQLAQSAAVQNAAHERLGQAMSVADTRLSEELRSLDREISQLDRGFSRLFSLLDDGGITEEEFRSENKQRREQRERLLARKDGLETQMAQRHSRQQELEHALAILKDFDALWEVMSQGERRQLLLQVDPHMTMRKEERFNVLTIQPAFADPIELTFVRTPPRAHFYCGPDARLTRRQLALLCLWDDGLSYADMARRWDIAVGTVRWTGKCIRTRLGVDTIEEAIELKRQDFERCRATLPLDGRSQKRSASDPHILTDATMAVLRLMAEGKGCAAIAKALGKDKSTISRQMARVCSRLGVSTCKEAVARGIELDLIPQAGSQPEDEEEG